MTAHLHRSFHRGGWAGVTVYQVFLAGWWAKSVFTLNLSLWFTKCDHLLMLRKSWRWPLRSCWDRIQSFSFMVANQIVQIHILGRLTCYTNNVCPLLFVFVTLTFQCCKVLYHGIMNCCAKFWCLINLKTSGPVAKTALLDPVVPLVPEKTHPQHHSSLAPLVLTRHCCVLNEKLTSAYKHVHNDIANMVMFSIMMPTILFYHVSMLTAANYHLA